MVSPSFLFCSVTVCVMCRWLLHDPHMALRSTYPPYLEAVERYFERLFGILAPLQLSRGGPIIAMQLENELAHFSSDTSRPYLTFLYKVSALYSSRQAE